MRLGLALFMLLLLQLSGLPAARAALPADPSALCSKAISVTERGARLPPFLLQTIGMVESGRRDTRSGVVSPWPWTINVEGAGYFFDTKDQAVAAVKLLQARGIVSIDVGCMQINLMHHPDAFASLEQAFEPQANVGYAARFLKGLYSQTNAWPAAAAAYHSLTPQIGADYQRQVMALWPLARLYASHAASQPPDQRTPELDDRLARDTLDREQIYARMREPAARHAHADRAIAAKLPERGDFARRLQNLAISNSAFPSPLAR